MLNPLVKYSLMIFGFYHLIAGSFVLGPHRWTQVFSMRVYKLEIPEKVDPRYFLCLKFLGLMALMVAGLSFILSFSSEPKSQALGLVFFGVLFLGRAFYRVLYRDIFVLAYNIAFERSLKNVIFNTILALCTFVLAWVCYADS